MIDTHAHLDALEDAAGALDRARAAGVSRVIAIGSGLASARATREIAARAAGVYVAAGVHPHQAADGEDPRRLVEPDIVAVGEIGLDFFRDYAPRGDQRRVFAAQLELASELGKPVVVHTRAAADESSRSATRTVRIVSQRGTVPGIPASELGGERVVVRGLGGHLLALRL